VLSYVWDAQGNPLAVYELLGGDTVVLNEFNLYGSSRLGMLTTADTLVCATCTTAVAPSVYLSPVGNKRYELSNHLGNVMTVISDKITPIDTTSDGLWDYFNPSLVSATDYYPFGMGMPGRNYNNSEYCYGLNGHEKTDEISGNGNHYTAMFWEYNPRLIRRWNLDPLVKPWESGYAAFGNSPIWYSDPLGLDVVNAHEAEKEKAEAKLGTVREKLAGLKKGDEGYKAAKKELRQAERAFNNINSKFQRVESKINEIQEKDPGLFNQADNLLDPGGTEINIYVYDTPEDVMQLGVREGMVKFGDTRALEGTQYTSADGSTPDYTGVRTIKPGNENKPGETKYTDNLIVIRVSDVAKTIHLAHEFGHAIYQGKNMKQYVEWLKAHPTEAGKGGHGKGDPSGKAAHDAEKNFK
jgi:hypothetical protein